MHGLVRPVHFQPSGARRARRGAGRSLRSKARGSAQSSARGRLFGLLVRILQVSLEVAGFTHFIDLISGLIPRGSASGTAFLGLSSTGMSATRTQVWILSGPTEFYIGVEVIK